MAALPGRGAGLDLFMGLFAGPHRKQFVSARSTDIGAKFLLEGIEAALVTSGVSFGETLGGGGIMVLGLFLCGLGSVEKRFDALTQILKLRRAFLLDLLTSELCFGVVHFSSFMRRHHL